MMICRPNEKANDNDNVQKSLSSILGHPLYYGIIYLKAELGSNLF